MNETVPTVLALLSDELRQLRPAGLSQTKAAKSAGIDRATLSKIENGHARPQEGTLDRLLDLYAVSAWKRVYLRALRGEVRSPAWLQRLQGEISNEYTAFIYLESKAVAIRCWETLIIPGLLQTAAYARALVAGAKPEASPGQIGARVQARMERQKQALEGGRLHFTAVITEAALRYQVGGRDVMRGQLAHLLELCDASNITLQVIPLDGDAHPSMMASFVILEFQPGNPVMVYLETATEARFLVKASHVERHGAIHKRLQENALDPAATKSLIAGRLAELEEEDKICSGGGNQVTPERKGIALK